MVKDRHVIEALGRTRVVIEDGEVVSVDSPKIDYCPIFKKVDDADELTREYIKKNITKRIRNFGMCTPQREVTMDDFLTMGVSEILRSNVESGTIDCVVGACDGVGTLLMTDPDIIQGVGGRVSALVSTTPIPEVIEKVGRENVINPDTAELDPIKGLEEAITRGYKNIAVTILPSPVIKDLKEYESDDVNVYIFVAHTTGVSMEETEFLFNYADIITSCASLNIRDYARENKAYYSGSKVPIYVGSQNGREMLDIRLKAMGKPLSNNEYSGNRINNPSPLI